MSIRLWGRCTYPASGPVRSQGRCTKPASGPENLNEYKSLESKFSSFKGMAFKIYAYNVQYTLVRELRCDHNGNNYQKRFLNIFLLAPPPSNTHTHTERIGCDTSKTSRRIVRHMFVHNEYENQLNYFRLGLRSIQTK